jgi:hypothetical protein
MQDTTMRLIRSRFTQSGRSRIVLLTLLVLTVATIPVWAHFDKPAWDAEIYHKAVESIQMGHDPYADGIAAQQIAHNGAAGTPSPDGPFSYVYSPITLPLVRVIAALPLWLTGSLFWLCYLAGVLGELWFGLQALQGGSRAERNFFLSVLPLAIFFPGFLACDTILSGNVAFMLYGLVLSTAVLAWRRGEWRWFYVATLAASCVKAPLLSLLAIPVLSARRQWRAAGITAAAGVGLFLVQPMLWPKLFREYLQAVELQFSFNRDFGFSPAGLFSGVLFDHHIPYSPACTIFYALYAIPLFGFLLFLSRRYLRGEFALAQWIPVLMLGVVLLNPRLIEYDAAPLALPAALIAWRFLAAIVPPRRTILYFTLLFIAVNAIALTGWQIWKLTEGPLLVALFAAGAYTLLRSRSVPVHEERQETEALLVRA